MPERGAGLDIERPRAPADSDQDRDAEHDVQQMEAGEKDTHRLTVCGLTYLRQLDGSVDPVKAGYTGL